MKKLIIGIEISVALLAIGAFKLSAEAGMRVLVVGALIWALIYGTWYYGVRNKTLLIAFAALALCSCANPDAGYWQARQAAIAGLPPEQRQSAEIDLMRDQHAQVELQRQRIADIVNSSIQ